MSDDIIPASTQLDVAETSVKRSLQHYAQVLTNLPDTEMKTAIDFLRKLEDMADSVKKTLSSRVQRRVFAEGRKITDAGSMEAEIEGKIWRITPTGSNSPDTDKVAAILLAKGHTDVNRFFTQRTKTVCTAGDLALLVAPLGILTQEEAQACMPKRSYKVEIKEPKE